MVKNLKKLFLVTLVSFISLVNIEANKIVATVNKYCITESEVNKRKNLIMFLQKKNNIPNIEKKIFNRQIIKQIINEKLIEIEANKFEISVTEEEIDDQISRIAAAYNMAPGEIKNSMTKQDASLYGSLREQVKNDILWQKISFEYRVMVKPHINEIRDVIIESNSKDMLMSFYLYKSTNYKSLMKLKEAVIKNNKYNSSMLPGDVDSEYFNSEISSLNIDIQNILKNIKNNEFSNIIKTDEGYKMFFVEFSDFADLSDKENEFVTNIVYNNKMKFLMMKVKRLLWKRASIKYV